MTERESGQPIATPIWSMVVDGVPYIRSAYDEDSLWCRRVRGGSPVQFVDGDGAIAESDKEAALKLPRLDVKLVDIAADEPFQSAISDSASKKNAVSVAGALEMFLEPLSIGSTFCVDPSYLLQLGVIVSILSGDRYLSLGSS